MINSSLDRNFEKHCFLSSSSSLLFHLAKIFDVYSLNDFFLSQFKPVFFFLPSFHVGTVIV